MKASLRQIIRAFVWLRWRLLVNSVKGGRRRDTLERLSRAASALLPIAFAIVIVPSFFVSCALALIGGWALGKQAVPTTGVIIGLRVLLGIVCAAVVLAPAVRSIRGGSSGLARFLLLPIPRTLLFVADAISGLLDPWIALVIPILLLFPVGLAAAGRFGAAAFAMGAGIGMLAAYVGLESSVSHLLRLLYRSRRRGEMVTLIFFFALSLSGFVPLIMTSAKHYRWDHPGRARERAEEIAATDHGTRITSEIPLREHRVEDPEVRISAPDLYVSVVPSEAYGRTIELAVSGRPGLASVTLALLFGLAAALIGLAWSAHERLLDSPETGGRVRSSRKERLLGKRLPGLSSATSALAFIQVRLLLRSVQGKMALYFAPVSYLLSVFLLTRFKVIDLTDLLGDISGPAFVAAGIVYSLLALQKIMMNQFAIDGPGLTLQLLAPLSERDLVLGKAAGLGLLCSASMVFYLVIALAIFPGTSPWLWPAVVLFGVSVYILLSPFALMLSALFPKAADLNRFGKSGSPNQLAAFIGLFVVLLAFVPPLGLAALTLLVTDSPAWTLAAIAAWTVVAMAVSVLLFSLCERVVTIRRENIGLTAQGR